MSNYLSTYEMVLVVGGVADGTVHQVTDGIVKMVCNGHIYTRIKIGADGGNSCSVFIPEDQKDKSISAVITTLIKGYRNE